MVKKKDNLLGVSADGVLECQNGYTNCKFNCSEKCGIKPIPVEIKCPYNKDNPYYDKYYNMPEIYVPQVTSEICAFGADKCLLATKSDNSVIIKLVSKHDFTWELECQVLTDFYDHAISSKPTKFHSKRNELKKQVKLYFQFKCDVIAELPVVHGCEIVCNERDGDSPFRKRKDFTHSRIDLKLLLDKVNIVAAESKCVVKDAHNICRDKASEILLFMLSDSDRMKLINDDTYTHPLGYTMKGYSLKVETICDMIEYLQNVLHQKNIPVLCECFDGQWANLAFKDREGDPLTILHLLNKSWEVAHNLSTRGVLLKLKHLSTYRVQDLVSVSQDITYGKTSSKWGNISATVNKKINGEIYYTLESNGGHLEEKNLLCHASMHKVRRFFDSEINNYSKDINQMKPVRGIQPDDLDIISALEPTLVKEIYEDQENENNSGQVGLEDFLASPKLQIITDILIHLQELGKSDFWADCTEEDLFPHVLMDKGMLMTFTKHDLDIIGSRIEKCTIRKMFSTKDNKDMKAAKISFLFGSGQLVYSTNKKVPMLKVIAQNCFAFFHVHHDTFCLCVVVFIVLLYCLIVAFCYQHLVSFRL